MNIVTAVTLSNGYLLNPDNARDAALLQAAVTTSQGGLIHKRMVTILKGAHAEVYDVARRGADTWVLK